MARLILISVIALVATLGFAGGSQPSAIASTTYAFVPDSENDLVRVLDGGLNEVAAIPVGEEPLGIDWSPDGSRVYVSNRVGGTLSIIDTASLTTIGAPVAIGTGCYLLGVTVSPDGQSVYIASNHCSHAVWHYEVGTGLVTPVIGNSGAGGGGVWDTAVSPDGMRLYVARSFESKLQVYDTLSYALLDEVDLLPGAEPLDVELNSTGSLAFVPHGSPSPGSYALYIIDTATLAVVAAVPAGASPTHVALNACGDRAYVSNYEGNTLTVVDLVAAGNPVTTYGPISAAGPSYPFGIDINPSDGSVLLSEDAPNGVIRLSALGSVVGTASFGGANTTGQVARGQFFAPQPPPADCDPDDDNDGVPDDEDACPTLPGPASRQGCPSACDATPTILGTNGNDHITGTPGDDVIFALDGNDRIDGGGGNDLICAGNGNDHVETGAGNDVVDLGNGNDHVTDAGGDNDIDGGNGNDKVVTGDGVDTIATGDGNDNITSGGGNDTINSGDGNDKVVAGGGDDTISAGAGNDNVDGGADFDACDAGSGNNQVTNCEA